MQKKNYKIILPPALKLVVDKLEKSGYEAYAVGGFVRDCLLARDCYDYDVTTNATPSEVNACFFDYTVIATGLKHGTITVLVGNTCVEVTTYRIDGTYGDYRHPDKVCFATKLADDLMRRDFTINALAYNERVGLVDLHGGIDDINQCTISAIGDPCNRFKEDALRILRAFRFSAQLGFCINKQTKSAIEKHAHLLGNISRERITLELVKILTSDNAQVVVSEMDTLGVLSEVISEYELPTKLCNEPIFTVRLAQLVDSYDATSRLRFDKKTASELRMLLEYKNKPIPCERILFKKLMCDVGVERFLLILHLCCYDTDEHFQLYNDIVSSGECVNIPMLAVNGGDLVELGFSGYGVGQTLTKLLDLVITGVCKNDKELLLDLAREKNIVI